MDPATLALITTLLSAGGSALSGMFGRKQISDTERSQNQLIDDLLASVRGQGPFSDMFDMSEDAFNKSFVEPAKARFQNQIAPQIQQGYIASGQQRGTGLEDTLTRAGVDMDQMLNQQYMDFLQQALNRKAGAFNTALGYQPNTEESLGQAATRGLGGYFAGKGFSTNVGQFGRGLQGKDIFGENQRRGFEG